MSTPAERAAEFHRLIEPYAFAIRSQRLLGYEPDALLQQARREHLDELAAVLNATQSATYDVDEAVERWISTHPLAMTGTGMKRVIDTTSGQGNGVAAYVQIGDPTKGGRHYPLHEGQLTHDNGTLLLRLPDSIAEEFRQQGRRAYQREIHRALGL